MNATCGNATELIIAILALTQGKIDVVKFSLLGSVLSNLLLVLGTSLFCGGIINKEQTYDRVSNTSLSLSLVILIFYEPSKFTANTYCYIWLFFLSLLSKF